MTKINRPREERSLEWRMMAEWVSCLFFLLSSFLLIILLLFNLYLLPSSIKRGHGQRQQRDQRGRQQQRGQRVRVRLFFFFFLCVHLFFISLFFFSHYFLSHKYINMQCRTGRDFDASTQIQTISHKCDSTKVYRYATSESCFSDIECSFCISDPYF